MGQGWASIREAREDPPTPGHTVSGGLFSVSACVDHKVLWPCVGVGVLMGLFAFTLLCVIVQLIRITIHQRKWWSHQQLILILAAIEVVLGLIHYGAVQAHAMILALTWLKLLQLVVICFFFASAALRIFRKEYLMRWVVVPILVLVSVYLTGVWIAGSIGSLRKGDECKDLAWLIFSVSGFVLTVIFMLASFIILWKLSRIEASQRMRQKSKLQLWSLSIIWFFTTLGVMLYDIFLTLASTGGDECDLYLRHNLAADALVHVCLRTFELLFPIWAVCYAFNDAARPAPKQNVLAPMARMRRDRPSGDNSRSSSTEYTGGPDSFRNFRAYADLQSSFDPTPPSLAATMRASGSFSPYNSPHN